MSGGVCRTLVVVVSNGECDCGCDADEVDVWTTGEASGCGGSKRGWQLAKLRLAQHISHDAQIPGI